VAHSIDVDRCINCGQCLVNCPFGAIEQMSFVDEVAEKLKDPEWTVVAIIAPAVRVALAEEFGAPPGTLTVGRMHNALKKVGKFVKSVHCKDGVGPTENGQLGTEKPLGAGDVDIPRFIRHLLVRDLSGALAAIQGLYRQNLELQAENDELRARVDELEARMAAMEEVLAETSVAGGER